ncbi:MAG: sugar ABC transporter permease [Treponemataceae bacterium]|nr:sugar ABC transporter permease [Treponemataceae bacterium]HOJ99765.1 sugar ABC transporter permease [Termitinemataceae bacterium]HOM23659.1 sugar ABC transporter permease [Termitinemataceae bacterium]HPQ01387.1 sugar ABC transporter permease [Termitinemataceae bacterium]
MTYTVQKKVIITLFLCVPLLLLLVFGYLPILNMIGYSFTRWDGLGKKEWVGLANYLELFTRVENFRVFFVSIYYFVGAFIQLALALFFATLLNFPIKGQNLFKGILFFPNLINGVAIGFIFLYFFRDTGTLNTFLRFLGFKGQILWLTDPRVINYSLAATSIWRYMGFNMVMFLGAFQSISQEIYEAAALDGAERWNLFRYIMFPIIKPVVKLNLILSIKGALSVFEIPYIMTGGGNGSSTFVIRTIDTAFKFNKIGLASAMAVVLTIIILLITAIQEKMFKEERYL